MTHSASNVGVILKSWLWDHSTSLKMAPIYRSCTILYAIVSIASSCAIFELFDVQYIVTLKSWLRAT